MFPKTVFINSVVETKIVHEAFVQAIISLDTIYPATDIPETVVPATVFPETVVRKSVIQAKIVHESFIKATISLDTIYPATNIS